jgi:hypothetical protein
MRSGPSKKKREPGPALTAPAFVLLLWGRRSQDKVLFQTSVQEALFQISMQFECRAPCGELAPPVRDRGAITNHREMQDQKQRSFLIRMKGLVTLSEGDRSHAR